MISGIFIIDGLKDRDAEGFERVARAHNSMDPGLESDLYLPPALRPSQCNITIGKRVFGIADEATGIGCALYGIDCDISYENKGNYHFTKTLKVDGDVDFLSKLTVTKDIKSTGGDVKAGTISLKTHIHRITTIPSQDAASIVSAATSGLPAGLTLTYTIIPS